MLSARLLWFLSILVALCPCQVRADNPVTWDFDVFTTGDDVFWTSPSAITLGLPEYDWSYHVTEFTATIDLLGEFNLLSSLGENVSGMGTATDLPIVLFEQSVSEPQTGSSANLKIEVDTNGFGQVSATDVTLGSVSFLAVRRVDMKATVSIVGIPTGDYNRDGTVDAADFAIWQGDFGSTTNLNADGNDNLVVDAADFTIWRDNLNASAPGLTGAGAATPEPTTSFMALGFLAVCGMRRSLPRSVKLARFRQIEPPNFIRDSGTTP